MGKRQHVLEEIETDNIVFPRESLSPWLTFTKMFQRMFIRASILSEAEVKRQLLKRPVGLYLDKRSGKYVIFYNRSTWKLYESWCEHNKPLTRIYAVVHRRPTKTEREAWLFSDGVIDVLCHATKSGLLKKLALVFFEIYPDIATHHIRVNSVRELLKSLDANKNYASEINREVEAVRAQKQAAAQTEKYDDDNGAIARYSEEKLLWRNEGDKNEN